MKAIVNTAPNRVEWRECPKPEPQASQVRIRTAACGICATDLEMITGWERTGFPAIPGHEWSGAVDAVGAGVDESLLGRHCVAENVLSDGSEVGFERPGGYAEYFLTECEKVHVLPDDLSFGTAALMEPLAVSVRGMTRLGSDIDGPAIVFGDGPIGLLMLQLLSGQGIKDLALVGGRANRLRLAEELSGARTLNYHEIAADLTDAVGSHLGKGFGTIIEASGSAAALAVAGDIAGPCGNILVMGSYDRGARANFIWHHLLIREISIICSNASAGAWPEALRLMVNGLVELDSLITHRLPAAECHRALEIAKDRRAEAIKVILEW